MPLQLFQSLGHKYINSSVYQLVLKILSGNEILTSVKGHNSVTVTNLRKNDAYQSQSTSYQYTKFGRIQSICSQDTERKQNDD